MPFAASKTAAAATSAAALLILTACGQAAAPSVSPSEATPSASPSASTSPSPSASTKPIKPSNNLDAITVKNPKFGATPKITVKAPWAIDQTRVKVMTEGKGPVVNPSYVFVNYLGVNGRTGKEFDGNFGKTSTMFDLSSVVPGFKKALEGKKVGTRVLVAMPGSDGYDSQGGSEQAGIKVGDTLIFVVDIVDTVLTGPTGAAITPPAGLPTVTEANGKPTITIPKADPPAKMIAQPLTAGTGRKVTAKDVIAVHYVAVSWKTGKVIEDKTTGVDGGLLSSTIPGWQKGLVGKKVGQRVLLVLPPADSYPKGSNNPPVEAGDTVVYVVDLLYATAQG
ncbi:MAG: FKBP-type peptidyl-prolyl cis-trans isomerase [Micropruina sp.]|uniref:FKBP-type peptidyl-prolyl cis-trans isomerase n=1 Tax=Micropruina sp. TaxID=2737536 RepID=UPI0039E4A63B